MKKIYLTIFIYLICINYGQAQFSIDILPDTLLLDFKKIEKKHLVPIDIEIKTNQLNSSFVLYNFTNYSELSNLLYEDIDYNEKVDGFLFFFTNFIETKKTGLPCGYVGPLKCEPLGQDSIRTKIIKKRNKYEKTDYDVYNDFLNNKIILSENYSFTKTIYVEIPVAKGEYELYFMYGQSNWSKQFYMNDNEINKEEVNFFNGIIISDTLNVNILPHKEYKNQIKKRKKGKK